MKSGRTPVYGSDVLFVYGAPIVDREVTEPHSVESQCPISCLTDRSDDIWDASCDLMIQQCDFCRKLHLYISALQAENIREIYFVMHFNSDYPIWKDEILN